MPVDSTVGRPPVASPVSALFSRLDAHELRIVQALVARSRRPGLQALAAILDRLGNGWLYLGIALAAPLFAGRGSVRMAFVASLAVGLAFCVYPLMKSRLARVRPCDVDLALRSAIKPRDRYSCPSGHCMTAAAVGVPLTWVFPQATAVIVAGWFMIAWSRLSLGHHYPTDLVLGAGLGSAISLAVSAFLL